MKQIYIVVGVIVVAAVAAALWFSGMIPVGGGSTDTASSTASTTTTDLTDLPDVVAKVNGVSISREDFLAIANVVAQNATQFGVNVGDPEVQQLIAQQAVDQAVNNELLLVAAQEAGTVASSSEIESIIAVANSQAEAASTTLTEQLEGAGLTMDEFRTNLERDSLVGTFINAELGLDSIEVAELEIQELYNEAAASNPAIEPLEDVRELVEQQVRANKEQQLILEFIQSLREGADVEILI